MDKYDVAATLAVNELDNMEYHKVPASKQREMFGRVLFGRKSFNADPMNQGTIRIGWWAGPTDFVTNVYSYAEFANLINSGKAINF